MSAVLEFDTCSSNFTDYVAVLRRPTPKTWKNKRKTKNFLYNQHLSRTSFRKIADPSKKHQKSLLIVISFKQNAPVSDEWKFETFPSKFTDYVEVVGRPMPLGNKSKT